MVRPVHLKHVVGLCCSNCETYSQERERKGKRRTSVGVYRSKVLLCDEKNPEESMITDRFENISLMWMQSVKRLAQHLCRRVNSSKGVAIRMSEERPPSNFYCRNLIRKQLIGDCDGFVWREGVLSAHRHSHCRLAWACEELEHQNAMINSQPGISSALYPFIWAVLSFWS